MTRLFFFGGILADVGASVLHFSNGFSDVPKVVVLVIGGLMVSGAWRTVHWMLEVTEGRPLEIPLR